LFSLVPGKILLSPLTMSSDGFTTLTSQLHHAEVTVLREQQTSIEVSKEEKRGLETKVRVLEELREKVVRIEAEVDVGRRRHEAW